MTVTAVPIRPIEKGSLVKLWGGLALAVGIAGALAWAGTGGFKANECGENAFLAEGKDVKAPITTATGLQFQTVKAGKGTSPTDADVALINYRGTFAKDGKEFDANQNVPMPVGGTIPGFTEALKMMQPDGSYRICIPAKLAYGKEGAGGGRIPPNAVLRFEVEMKAHMPMAAFQQRMQAMQQQQGGASAPPPGR